MDREKHHLRVNKVIDLIKSDFDKIKELVDVNYINNGVLEEHLPKYNELQKKSMCTSSLELDCHPDNYFQTPWLETQKMHINKYLAIKDIHLWQPYVVSVDFVA